MLFNASLQWPFNQKPPKVNPGNSTGLMPLEYYSCLYCIVSLARYAFSYF